MIDPQVTLFPLTTTDQKHQLLESFDPRHNTWLVSDLTSKSEIQNKLLARTPVLEEDAVLRASELWAKIFKKTHPDWRLVSVQYMQSYLSDFLRRQKSSLVQSPEAFSTLLTFLEQLLPMIADPDLDLERWGHWFRDNPESYIRWGHWFELAHHAWDSMAHDKISTVAWCSSLILSRPELSQTWQRQIFCDLGSRLQATEAQVLKALSQNVRVVVLKPEADWVETYAQTLNGYFPLKPKAGAQISALKSRPLPKSSVEHRVEINRYATMVAEIKDVVAKVRSHLEQGYRPHEVAIFAPEIELYWPALSLYLEEEGVPKAKDRVLRMISLPDVDFWLARLRIACGRISANDLERSQFYETRSVSDLGFDGFKRLFSIVYDEFDLRRWSSVEKSFKKSVQEEEEWNIDNFLGWASSFWPNHKNTDALVRFMKKMFQECPVETEKPIASWLQYLENLVCKEESIVRQGVPDGVSCLNLQNGEWVPAKVRFFIGLSSSALRSQSSVGLLYQDVEKIDRDLGYILAWPDKAQLEFDGLWLLQKPADHTYLSVSNTDFSGNPEAPSLLWLLAAFRNNRHVEELSLPSPTRWDELQKCSLSQIATIREWPLEQSERVEEAILQDLGAKEFTKLTMPDHVSVSASQIENYIECPFKFAASKLFSLTDEALVDLDIDAMSKGRLLHKLLEILVESPFRANWSDEELSAVIADLPQKAEVPVGDKRLWRQREGHYLDLAKRFLAYENQLRTQFPQIETVGREIRFVADWSLDTAGFVPQGEGDLSFRGSIDRVDTDGEGQYLVLDYKSSPTGLHYFKSWMTHSEIQLPLYSLAVEAGVTPLEKGPVIGAFYYVAKNMTRQTGFRLVESAGTLYDLNEGRSANATEQQKLELFQQVREKVNQTLNCMKDGQFQPQPQKEDICQQCSWKKICRAHHLNR